MSELVTCAWKREDEYACVGVHLAKMAECKMDGGLLGVRGVVSYDGLLCYAMRFYAMLCYGNEFLAEKL
ncbi:hypothetical protein EAE99_005017 [Botrytis elliptica]|nr:hypothetical protein EAE99_005017 [Botrytis elliptica]